MSSNQQQQSDTGGCFAFFLVIVLIALVAAAIISLAALVDPFSWLPPVGKIWQHCEGDCDLAHRFPGFWPHVLANLGYVIVSICLLGWLMVAVSDLRKARAQRFAGLEQARRYGSARQAVATAATLCGLLAALPIAVAMA